MERHLSETYAGLSAAGWAVFAFALLFVLIVLDRFLCRRDVGDPLWRFQKSPAPAVPQEPLEEGWERRADPEFERRKLHPIAVQREDPALIAFETELARAEAANAKKQKKKGGKGHHTATVV